MVGKGNAPRRSRIRKNVAAGVLPSPASSPMTPSHNSPFSPSPSSDPSLTTPAPMHTTTSVPGTNDMTGLTPNDLLHTDHRGSPAIPTHPDVVCSSAASQDLPSLTVKDGHFKPRDKEPARIIGKTITKKYDGCWPTYTSIPEMNRDLWWDHFKTHFSINEDVSGAVRDLFETRAARQLSTMLYEVREIYFTTKQKVDWIPQEAFDELVEYWQSDTFKNRSNVNKANRSRKKDGRPVGKHTGGSRSAHDTKIYLEELWKRPVAAAEVFTYMHTNKKDNTPVDEVAADIEQRFKESVSEEILSYMGQDETPIPAELMKKADKALVSCAGGVQRGRIRGLGNLSTKYNGVTSFHSEYIPNETRDEVISQLTQENHKLSEDVQTMKEKLNEQERKTSAELARIAKIVAHFAGHNDLSDDDSIE